MNEPLSARRSQRGDAARNRESFRAMPREQRNALTSTFWRRFEDFFGEPEASIAGHMALSELTYSCKRCFAKIRIAKGHRGNLRQHFVAHHLHEGMDMTAVVNVPEACSEGFLAADDGDDDDDGDDGAGIGISGVPALRREPGRRASVDGAGDAAAKRGSNNSSSNSSNSGHSPVAVPAAFLDSLAAFTADASNSMSGDCGRSTRPFQLLEPTQACTLAHAHHTPAHEATASAASERALHMVLLAAWVTAAQLMPFRVLDQAEAQEEVALSEKGGHDGDGDGGGDGDGDDDAEASRASSDASKRGYAEPCSRSCSSQDSPKSCEQRCGNLRLLISALAQTEASTADEPSKHARAAQVCLPSTITIAQQVIPAVASAVMGQIQRLLKGVTDISLTARPVAVDSFSEGPAALISAHWITVADTSDPEASTTTIRPGKPIRAVLGLVALAAPAPELALLALLANWCIQPSSLVAVVVPASPVAILPDVEAAATGQEPFEGAYGGLGTAAHSSAAASVLRATIERALAVAPRSRAVLLPSIPQLLCAAVARQLHAIAPMALCALPRDTPQHRAAARLLRAPTPSPGTLAAAAQAQLAEAHSSITAVCEAAHVMECAAADGAMLQLAVAATALRAVVRVLSSSSSNSVAQSVAATVTAVLQRLLTYSPVPCALAMHPISQSGLELPWSSNEIKTFHDAAGAETNCSLTTRQQGTSASAQDLSEWLPSARSQPLKPTPPEASSSASTRTDGGGPAEGRHQLFASLLSLHPELLTRQTTPQTAAAQPARKRGPQPDSAQMPSGDDKRWRTTSSARSPASQLQQLYAQLSRIRGDSSETADAVASIAMTRETPACERLMSAVAAIPCSPESLLSPPSRCGKGRTRQTLAASLGPPATQPELEHQQREYEALLLRSAFGGARGREFGAEAIQAAFQIFGNQHLIVPLGVGPK
jgi:hypothetical protein